MSMVKRNRSEDREIETLAMANCLMLLSRVGETKGRVFTCKTCDRQFVSFQALGGHSASHKKPRLVTWDQNGRSPLTKASKPHGCLICGQEFAIGQALGGHMRRHRASPGKVEGPTELTELVKPILKKSSSGSKRVLSLDLNLTPYEYDVKFA